MNATPGPRAPGLRADTARPALVLLPGVLCDATVWTDQMAGLAERADVTVGDLDGAEGIVGMADAVLALSPDRFAVAGHSMGGRVALEIVRRAPHRVLALALLDCGAHPPEPREREGRLALLALARAEGMAALAERWTRAMLHPERQSDAPLVETLRAMAARCAPDRFERQVRALLERADARELLPVIRCPTLVLCGRQDDWCPLSHHEAMAAAIPGAVLAVVENCGHMATVEQPQAVTTALSAWLDRLRDPAATTH